MARKAYRPQTQKPRNLALARAMQDKRRGSATEPVPSGRRYNRNVKYRHRVFLEV